MDGNKLPAMETNSNSPWKWMVGRWISFWDGPTFKGYASFRESRPLKGPRQGIWPLEVTITYPNLILQFSGEKPKQEMQNPADTCWLGFSCYPLWLEWYQALLWNATSTDILTTALRTSTTVPTKHTVLRIFHPSYVCSKEPRSCHTCHLKGANGLVFTVAENFMWKVTISSANLDLPGRPLLGVLKMSKFKCHYFFEATILLRLSFNNFWATPFDSMTQIQHRKRATDANRLTLSYLLVYTPLIHKLTGFLPRGIKNGNKPFNETCQCLASKYSLTVCSWCPDPKWSRHCKGFEYHPAPPRGDLVSWSTILKKATVSSSGNHKLNLLETGWNHLGSKTSVSLSKKHLHQKLFLTIQISSRCSWIQWLQVLANYSEDDITLEWFNTVDGRNPAPPGMYISNPVNNGINYQPQLVSRISTSNSMIQSV